MTLKKITIDQYLYEVLTEMTDRSPTVTELRDRYLAKLRIKVSPDEARKGIYRQLLRLMKCGVLTKKTNKNPQKSTYQRTDKFSKVTFKPTLPSHQKQPRVLKPDVSEPAQQILVFEEQLKQYQVDLLSSIGESEEYKRLYTLNPELKELLEVQYHQARDKSSKLLGQIKAIETVLSHLSKQK